MNLVGRFVGIVLKTIHPIMLSNEIAREIKRNCSNVGEEIESGIKRKNCRKDEHRITIVPDAAATVCLTFTLLFNGGAIRTCESWSINLSFEWRRPAPRPPL